MCSHRRIFSLTGNRLSGADDAVPKLRTQRAVRPSLHQRASAPGFDMIEELCRPGKASGDCN